MSVEVEHVAVASTTEAKEQVLEKKEGSEAVKENESHKQEDSCVEPQDKETIQQCPPTQVMDDDLLSSVYDSDRNKSDSDSDSDDDDDEIVVYYNKTDEKDQGQKIATTDSKVDDKARQDEADGRITPKRQISATSKQCPSAPKKKRKADEKM